MFLRLMTSSGKRKGEQMTTVLQRVLTAAALTASALGVSVALNAAPAAASTPCRVPNAVEHDHIKWCNASGSIYVKHRWADSIWYYNDDHIDECLLFESTYINQEKHEYSDFDAKVCHRIY
jgi:hypothetical protein